MTTDDKTLLCYMWYAYLYVSSKLYSGYRAVSNVCKMCIQQTKGVKKWFCSDNRSGRGETKERECYICLEPIWYAAVTNLLSCTHNDRFHTSCLWKWVVERSAKDFHRYGTFNLSCPICRHLRVSQICNVSSRNRWQMQT